MSVIPSTSGRFHSEFVHLLFLQVHRETERFFAVSGVQLSEPNSAQFHYLRSVLSSQFKSKVGSTLPKTTDLRVNINLHGTPITSRTHTHPLHSETSRLLPSSYTDNHILVFYIVLVLSIYNTHTTSRPEETYLEGMGGGVVCVYM